MDSQSSTEQEQSVTRQVMDLEAQYLLQNYSRYPLVVRRGKGCYIYDVDGKRYLDLITGIGVNALGHAHPRILRVIRDQAAQIIHCSNLYYHEYQGPLAKRLTEISGLERSFFCNSGTEAMEGALKMIRGHGTKISPDKYEIISLENSFHGRTLGALSITGQPKYRKDFEPLLPGVRFIPRDDIPALEQAFGPQTAGIVLEWIQGEGGIYPLSIEFVRRARELADQHDALLVFDEIQCGVGRPGKYFAYQLAEPAVVPDVVVAAKPLACGLPLGAIMSNEKAAAALGPGMHGTTFGGGPLSCRVALEALDIIREQLPHIHHIGGCFRAELAELGRRYSFIKEVRGFGLMIGLELEIPGKQIVLDGMAAGLLFNCTHDTVLRFLPPYIITEPEVDRAIKILASLFRRSERRRKRDTGIEMATLAEVLGGYVREGDLWEPLENKRIRCFACGHRCPIAEGQAGVCKVRFNRDGALYVPWDYVAGVQCDPIEKKPFFHVRPGAVALSFGMLGCDLHCSYCQNWVTSQAIRDPEAAAPVRATTPDAPGAAGAGIGRRSRGEHLQRAADHRRVGGGGISGGAPGRAADGFCFKRQRHA